jgi:hypothetical protein
MAASGNGEYDERSSTRAREWRRYCLLARRRAILCPLLVTALAGTSYRWPDSRFTWFSPLSSDETFAYPETRPSQRGQERKLEFGVQLSR